MKDCNNCASHVQGAHPSTVKLANGGTCNDCLASVGLPKWQPKVGAEFAGFKPVLFAPRPAMPSRFLHPTAPVDLPLFLIDPSGKAAPQMMKPTSGKLDAGKTGLHLLPTAPLEEIAKVLDFGAVKYAPGAWRKGMKWTRLLAATLRHVFAWARGQDNDPETNLSHLAHAGCCVLFLLQYVIEARRGDKIALDNDDRFKEAA